MYRFRSQHLHAHSPSGSGELEPWIDGSGPQGQLSAAGDPHQADAVWVDLRHGAQEIEASPQIMDTNRGERGTKEDCQRCRGMTATPRGRFVQQLSVTSLSEPQRLDNQHGII